jgi:cysteinyl-tRNA synthetase
VRLARQQMNTAPETDEGNSFQNRLDAARAEFKAAMDDDFNTPRAIAALQELTREVNALLNGDVAVGLAALDAINTTYEELGGQVLGLIPGSVTASATRSRSALINS